MSLEEYRPKGNEVQNKAMSVFIEFTGCSGNHYITRKTSICSLVRKNVVVETITYSANGRTEVKTEPSYSVFFGAISDQIDEETYNYIKESVFLEEKHVEKT